LASWKNHRNGSRAPFGPCFDRSAKYAVASMTVAGALLTLQQCKNAKISRRYSACFASGQPLAASAFFHAGNETARVSGFMNRVQLYAASASTAKSCTRPLLTSQASAKTHLFPSPAKAALGAAE
jgi:hypothetical protein